MKSSILLRVAAVLTLLHGILHTVGGVFGPVTPGAMRVAATAMQANRFQEMGVTRSYWDYYIGFGLFITVSFLVQAVVFWQLAAMAKTYALQTRPIVMAFFLGYLAYAALSLRYFFAAPVIFEIVIAGCLLGAWFLAGSTEQNS